MAESEFKRLLSSAKEIEITVIGRKSGQKISTPVWFVYEDNTLYLLAVNGSNTNWYKNILKEPTIEISVDKEKVTTKAKPIMDTDKIGEVAEKFRSKYGAANIEKYYSRLDAAAELSLE